MKRVLAGCLLTVILMVRPVLAVSVDVGTHYFEPNTPGQTFKLWMTTDTAETVGCVILELQVGQPPIEGAPNGPGIANIDLFTGTVLGAHPNEGELGYGSFANAGEYHVPQLYEAATATTWTPENPYDPNNFTFPPEYLAHGLLATVTIDTTGFSSGTWDLLAKDTLNDSTLFYHSDVELGPMPLTINNGSLVIVSTTLNSAANGVWSAGATWDGEGQTPGAGLKTAVGSHTVTVDANDSAFALAINQVDGKVVVSPGKTLSLGSIRSADLAAGTLDVQGTVQTAGSVQVGSGKVDLAPTGRLNVGTDLTLQSGAELVSRLALADGGLVAVTGALALDGKLTLSASEMLKPAGQFGAVPARVIATAGAGASGTFASEPAIGADLGHGVINLGVAYEANEVKVSLFQAGPGDCWNAATNAEGPDREVDVPDIQQILRAAKFNSGKPAVWNEGDFTGDALVTATDIQMVLSANLFKKGPYGAASEALADASAIPGVQLKLTDDGLLIDTAGATINGYIISSQTGILTGDPANNLGVFTEDSDSAISGQMLFALNGTHLLGDVIGGSAAGVNLAEDLSMSYTVEGQSGVYQATLVVPEPGTIALLLAGGLAAFALRWRRRKS